MSDTILLVEDETLVRMAIGQHLEDCGYDVLQASNALEALGLISGHDEIAVLFTDVRMPGPMDGLALAKWVVEHKPRIAVMVASGDTAKPYNFDEVTTRIREALQARRSS